MKLSVLMCIYRNNNPDHLRRALDSVWTDQTFKPHQIVLVQDGPLPPAVEFEVADFMSSTCAPVDLVKIEVNQGLTNALNRGIPHCAGDLIARMDADDIAAPNRFLAQVDFFRDNPRMDILGGSIQEFDENSDCLFVRTYPQTHKQIRRQISKGSPLAHPTVVFRRRVFDLGFRYNDNYRTSQDIEFWFRLMESGFLFANLEEVLLHFRIDSDFAARRSRKKALDEFNIYWNGIRRLHGWDWRLVFPILRLLFRYSPSGFVRKVYFGRVRRFLNS